MCIHVGCTILLVLTCLHTEGLCLTGHSAGIPWHVDEGVRFGTAVVSLTENAKVMLTCILTTLTSQTNGPQEEQLQLGDALLHSQTKLLHHAGHCAVMLKNVEHRLPEVKRKGRRVVLVMFF